MKRLRPLMASLLVALGTIPGIAQEALTAPLDELVAAAKKEGTVEFYATTTLKDKGARLLSEAFNKKYGLNIRVNYVPAISFTRDVAKVVGLAATGVPPEWDLMLIHDAGHATLWLRKLLKPFDYRKLGIDPELIHYDSGAVSFANQFALPAYNNKLLPAKDVPKSWEDLLDPKWKGGKLGMSTATHHIARLAAAWGETKTTEFVKALARQQPFLGTLQELSTRLLIGEIQVAITHLDEFIYQAKATGAPIVFAEEVQPVISPTLNAGVLKGARHPNAGHLFAVFLTTNEAQEIWGKDQGQTSAFVVGTPAYKYVQGKKVLYMTQEHAEIVDRLTREYGKIFGFGK
ncbi:MAG: extracellular solute-binding protein [Deltaproteobacteria bacterium]|nr:extracellular solute-binding protein [Deltaproteobacteria bacterium]